jgi:hypothetical protein
MDFRTSPLAPLTLYPQWVAWRIEPTIRNGVEVPAKMPYSPIHGGKASSTNPAEWSSYDDAVKYASATGMGVGFVFTSSDPFFFLDVDKALHAGQWSQLAQELCARFAGAAVEVSQSGTGLHIIGMYSAQPEHRKKNVPLGLELYTQERFVALTGTNAMGDASALMDDPLAAAVAQYFDPLKVAAGAPLDWTTEPVAEWSGPDDDSELLARAMRSEPAASAAAAFGDGAAPVRFSDLWTANAEVLAARYPGNGAGGYDASSADQALANALAFWTGKNCERIERMMRASSLTRDKWDDRPEWLADTIMNAVRFVKGVYAAPATAARPIAPPAEVTPGIHAGHPDLLGRVIFNHDLPMLFDGYVFVHGVDKIMTRDGRLLGKAGFDAEHNGPVWNPAIDGRRKTTSAWEALMTNEAYRLPIVDGMCFRPEQPDDRIIEEGRRNLLNMYVRPKLSLVDGDPSKFLTHMRRMLPVGDDLEILLSYFADCAQNPGVKVQWWPVLVGAGGSFKTTWVTIMRHALGSEYVHEVNTRKLVAGSSNFNGWIENKLFIALDEVYGRDRREFLEGFKPTVTNRTIDIEAKGKEQVTGDNRANGLFTSNDQAGLPILEGERRYAPFFYAYQETQKMWAAGMDSRYLGDLYSWFAGTDAYAELGRDYGFRVMAHYLHTRALSSAYDRVKAPETSSTLAAIKAGLGRAEQEVIEAIEEGQPGFAGGWVSSTKLDDLLTRKRMNVPPNKRRDMMKSIGYDWHPALANGRVNNVVSPDNNKPRLYCKVGSIAWSNLTDAAAVAAAYSKAQSVGLEETTRSQFNG